MKYLQLLLLLILGVNLHAEQLYKWAVIGAGPAGIISIAQLLEHGVNDHDIVWIDPEFATGRLGKYYGNVPSNQKAYRFTSFLEKSTIFANFDSPAIQAIKACNQQQEHPLQLAVDALNDITNYLRTQVISMQTTVQALESEPDKFSNNWRLTINQPAQAKILAQKVILAVGAHPKTLNYKNITEIPLDLALDETKLSTFITTNDTVMVIGSAHSALLIVKYLHDFGVKKIINLYTKEPTFKRTGELEGITAYWAQYVLLQTHPANIERVLFDPKTISLYLAQSTKIIYAFGYEPNKILVNGLTHLTCDQATGVIQKNLYGIGIAFPEIEQNKDGSCEKAIGLHAFIDRIKQLMPAWLQK